MHINKHILRVSRVSVLSAGLLARLAAIAPTESAEACAICIGDHECTWIVGVDGWGGCYFREDKCYGNGTPCYSG